MSIRTAVGNGVATIEIARPEKKNAITMAMYLAMAGALDAAMADAAVRAVLITGQPGIFTSGNDIEDSLIAHARSLGIAAERRENLTGMWIGPRKLASIGVGVRHWISLHGFALNVTPDSLIGFHSIVPCGLSGVEMTCLCSESGQPLTVEGVATALRPFLADALAILRESHGT